MPLTIDQIKAKSIPVLKKHGVKRASLFGSYVLGEQKRASDIDILIQYPENSGKSLLDFVSLEHELQQVLKKKVDLVTPNGVSPYLKNEILNSAKVFFEL